ncbi:MAG: hypothetical protein E7048_12085 [Lentisphaerae bacterium]|nr:hypothetical protein [Lentisphaerota bacterium]
MNSPRTNRVLQILAMVASNPKPTSLRSITTALGVHPSMVSRMVSDLIEAGLLTKSSYRNVITTPGVAVLGRNAAKNHPLARISLSLLREPAESLGFSCEFVTVTPMGLYHFFNVRKGTPPAAPLWNSDPAAVCLAAEGKTPEECQAILDAVDAPEQGRALFRERFEAARQNQMLLNYHSGRFWQLSIPVVCGELVCALAFAGLSAADVDKAQVECVKLAGQIRSAYKELIESNA